MPGPLEGIRVIDFGRFIAGPYCAMLLADFGADVIRVERRDGKEQTKNENPGTLLCRLDLNDPSHCRGRYSGDVGERPPSVRPHLNDPPTAVGGIRGRRRAASLCRPHLNDPPTAVGGIPGVFAQSLKRRVLSGPTASFV